MPFETVRKTTYSPQIDPNHSVNSVNGVSSAAFPMARQEGGNVDRRQFLGLVGILLATMTSEFNDQVTAIALVDVRGGFSISRDPGTWIQSLYVSAEIVGMAVSPWMLVTFSLRRWTLFSIALCGVSSALIPFSPNIEAIYALRLAQGFAGGLLIPLLMTTALRVFSNPNLRLYGLAVYALTAGLHQWTRREPRGAVDRSRGLALRLLPGRADDNAGRRAASGMAEPRTNLITSAFAFWTGAASCCSSSASAPSAPCSFKATGSTGSTPSSSAFSPSSARWAYRCSCSTSGCIRCRSSSCSCSADATSPTAASPSSLFSSLLRPARPSH